MNPLDTLNHKVDFGIGEIVYLLTDIDQRPWIVVAVCLWPNQCVTYCLRSGKEESWHYPIEISEEKNPLINV